MWRSCLSREAARDHDQTDEHGDSGDQEIADDGAVAMDVANQDRADADVSVDGGVGDEGKFAALESPGESCAAGDQEREQPDAVALRLEDSGEQRPEENVGGDVQVGGEEVRFESE